MAKERLQKILARCDLGSRRECERLITAGRVTVNGGRASIGDKADPSRDIIEVDGLKITIRNRKVYIAFYKPLGVLSTTKSSDPRKNIADLIEIRERIYPAGRLDIDSEGLLLLTNDGSLTYKLTHPRFAHEKEYRVLVSKIPDNQQLDVWRHGVTFSDGSKTAPAIVRIKNISGEKAWLQVILHEGKKRQIRKVGERIGLPVKKILRVRIGTLRLGNLKPGEWRYLSKGEVAALKQLVG